jgi:hypothetical protein
MDAPFPFGAAIMGHAPGVLANLATLRLPLSLLLVATLGLDFVSESMLQML